MTAADTRKDIMPAQEQYLLAANLRTVPAIRTGTLVIGGGIAGYSAALAASSDSPVILVAKGTIEETATYQAQGGIAAALAPDDRIELHVQDTLNAGAGLCDPDAVRFLATEGVERCRELINLGTPFDRLADGKVEFTREGAHSRRRIIHGDGDATGRVIMRALEKRVRENPAVHRLDSHFVIDLLDAGGACYGALVLDTVYGQILRIEAAATVVATGGLGQIFRETTNPASATGDGHALCYRAGATLRDMEFVQFHPTTLYLAGAPRYLISEAVRGEGAYLVNLAGERFMMNYSAEGELSPRDVVSQSIFRELNASGATHVCLDLRHMDPELVARRFPNILGVCAEYGLNLRRDLIPVRPAAHYIMGGVETNLDGETSVRRLYAAGEVACTGVHGANRLASNSLLEGLVFGHRAGMAAAAQKEDSPFPVTETIRRLPARGMRLDLEDIIRSLKALAWRNLGVFRDAGRLTEMISTIDSWSRYVMGEQFQMRGGFEVQNMLTVARLMAKSALQREESRGAHQRSDFPKTDPAWASRHNRMTIEDDS